MDFLAYIVSPGAGVSWGCFLLVFQHRAQCTISSLIQQPASIVKLRYVALFLTELHKKHVVSSREAMWKSKSL